jgi:hypothetical protein
VNLGQASVIRPEQIMMSPVGWFRSNLSATLPEWMLKVVSSSLGAFLIAAGSQYVYNLSKGQYRPAR